MTLGTLTVPRESLPYIDVGETVTLIVTCIASKIEGDLVDVSGFSARAGSELLAGQVTVELAATKIEGAVELCTR